MSKIQKRKELKKSVLLLVFTSTICLLIIVLIIFLTEQNHMSQYREWHDPNTKFDSELGWVPNENASIISFENKTISSNADGFRSEPVNHSKKQIVLVGDSITWGYGVSNNETVSYYLGQIMRANAEGLQVLNLGVSGYGLDQDYLYLKRKINETEPAWIIVIIFAGNDRNETSTSAMYDRNKPLLVVNDGKLDNVIGKISRYDCFNLFSHSYFVSRIRYLKSLESTLCHQVTLNDEQTTATITKIFEGFDSISKENNAKLLFVISPALEDFHSVHPVKVEYFAKMLGTKYQYLNYLEYVKENRINPDKLYLLAQPDNQWNDTAHYNPGGNKILAEAIYQTLLENN